MTYTHIEEKKSTGGGGRLGRHIDRRDSFARRHIDASQAPAPPTSTVNWQRLCPPFDQGALGSCTGNATAGALMTVPLHQPGWNFNETDAVKIYEQATQFNPPGEQYPPNDDGSSGPCVADALEKDGVVAKSVHATELTPMLGLLTLGPLILGLDWYTSFDTPLPSGECVLTPGATVRGGHEVEAFGVDPVTKMTRPPSHSPHPSPRLTSRTCVASTTVGHRPFQPSASASDRDRRWHPEHRPPFRQPTVRR